MIEAAIGQLLWNAITKVVEWRKERVAVTQDEYQSFFDHHVEPHYNTLQQVNDDYVAGLTLVRDHLLARTDPRQIIEILTSRRLEFFRERSELQSFATAFLAIEQRRFMNDQLLTHYCGFSKAIREYIIASTPSSIGLSWYSDLIGLLKMNIQMDESRAFEVPPDYIAGCPNPFSRLAESITIALNERMPQAMAAIVKHYLALRGYLL